MDVNSDQPATQVVWMLSPEYVEDFTPERGLAELVANALDADPKATFRYDAQQGAAVITDRGPGLHSRALVIGESTSRNRDDAVGRFGEGVQVGLLSLRRSGYEVRVETVGATIVPQLTRRSFGLGDEEVDVLVGHISPNRRRIGTRVTVTCDRNLFERTRRRFRQLWDRSYTPPNTWHGRLLADEPGVIRVGGVTIDTRDELVVGLDLSIRGAKNLLNRDRTTLDGFALRNQIRNATSHGITADAAEIILRAALEGRIDSMFEVDVPGNPEAERAWTTARRRVWGGGVWKDISWADSAHSPEVCYAQGVGEHIITSPYEYNAEAWRRVMAASGLTKFGPRSGVSPNAEFVWVARTKLEDSERKQLQQALRAARRLWGKDLVNGLTWRVFEQSQRNCDGIFDPKRQVIGIRRSLLDGSDHSAAALRETVAHELAHAFAFREGWEFEDCTSGFERALTALAAKALAPKR